MGLLVEGLVPTPTATSATRSPTNGRTRS